MKIITLPDAPPPGSSPSNGAGAGNSASAGNGVANSAPAGKAPIGRTPVDLTPVDVAPDAWFVCDGCRAILYGRRFVRNARVCPDCNRHAPLAAPERLDQLLDPGSVELLTLALPDSDPLGFVDTKPYPERVRDARRRTGLDEAVLCAAGRIDGKPVIVAAMDFRFMGGSLGSAVGEGITQAAELALRERTPLLIVTASGGARMQEGVFSLMQMAKTSNALTQLDEAGILTISLVTDPTFGGVAASFATLCDVILAEPGARLGFAGPRVIEQTIKQTLPPGFQTAEFLLAHGIVDMIRPRSELRATLATLLAVAGAPRRAGTDLPANSPTGGSPTGGSPSAAELPRLLPQQSPPPHQNRPPHQSRTAHQAPPLHQTPMPRPSPPPRPSAPPGTALIREPGELPIRDPWDVVRAARRFGRPTTLDYAALLLDDFNELHGDRMSADCPTIVCGLGRLDGIPVALIGTQKGRDVKELAERNFGMPTPAGYRKAARVMRLAAKLSIPVVTLIDTAGAYPGLVAEEQGQAVAIAENLGLMGSLPVPVVALITGEGGSGGALALAVADQVLMCANAAYSVISPEGCAAILWKDPAAAPRAAAALRVDARQLLALGVIDGVVPEPDGGAEGDPVHAATAIRDAILCTLGPLLAADPKVLVSRRRARFRRFGVGPPGPPGPPTPGSREYPTHDEKEDAR